MPDPTNLPDRLSFPPALPHMHTKRARRQHPALHSRSPRRTCMSLLYRNLQERSPLINGKTALVEVKNLEKVFQDTPRGLLHAVDDVNFRP